MKNLKRFFAFALTLMLLGGAVPVPAAAQEDTAEFDGYLFRLAEGIPMLMAEDMEESGIAPVAASWGIYQADTLEEIAAFVPAEYLEYVEPNYRVELMEVPNDPNYLDGKEWQMDSIDMSYAWEKGLDGTGVRIGIIDSGLRRTHEDLKNLNINYELSRNCCYPNPTPVQERDIDDETGHGTFVTGIIAAEANNGKGIAGIAPGAELVIFKAFGTEGGSLADVVRGIDYSVAAQCDTINMSFGIFKEKPLSNGERPDITSLDIAVKNADDAGVLMVASVGNYGHLEAYDNGRMKSYPAAYPEVIGVGALDKNEKYATSSQHNESVWMSAPGVNVYSTSMAGDSAYAVWSGTSFSTPCVTASVALALQAVPGMEREQVMERLKESAKDLGDTGWDERYGHGMLQTSVLLRLPQAPMVTQKAENGGMTIRVRYYQLDQNQEALMMATAYDAEGRMVSVGMVESRSDSAGILDAAAFVETTAPGCTVKLLLLDAQTWIPLAEPVAVTP